MVDLNIGFCFISAGKRKDQAPPEPEPSKRPKGPTTSVRQEKARVVQEAGGPPRQQRKEAHKQAKAQAQAHANASHAEADDIAPPVDLPEGAPVAIPEVQAASSPVAPDLEDGSSELELDSEGEELRESEFAEEEEDVVLFREPTVPKR
ncbi:hypothetical protein P8452_17322 [Trifolium repens]|nr:hypothetical protein P8452_17322 [Trifolium repens]